MSTEAVFKSNHPEVIEVSEEYQRQTEAFWGYVKSV